MAIVPNDVKIEDFIQQYTTLDEPIPYKELKIYPVKVKDIFKFLSSCDILTIDKNKIPDIKVIQMSYLQFIFEIMSGEKEWADKFLNIISVCFNLDEDKEWFVENFDKGVLLQQQLSEDKYLCFFNGWDIKFFIKENRVSLYLKDIEITSKEFDEIKRLIMYQNIVGYDDSYVDPDVKKIQDEYYRLKNKSVIHPTIEKQMSVISSENGMSKSEMLDMTYREFTMLFNTIVDKIDYQINKRADLQDKKFEKPIPHWIFEQGKNKFDGLFVDANGFEKKLESVL